MLRITVLGTGYVGLVSGVCLAEIGHHVTCVDKNWKKIDILNTGKSPIYEEGLEELMKKNMDSKRLAFTTKLEDSLNQSDIVMLAVGTPTLDDENGAVNLEFINSCVDEIAHTISKDIIVIVKSTVPVGTCDKIQERLNGNFECIVVSNPEFLREGSAVYDFMNPDRIIFGSDGRGMATLEKLYKELNDTKIISTDRKTAELVKYASNAFLAMKVGFINEMADISEKLGTDIKKLSEGIGSDNRIGNKFLNPGPGFGGSCFPKDTMAVFNLLNQLKLESPILRGIIPSNVLRIKKIVNEIAEIVPERATIAILGLAYKAGTDDVRDSPAIAIATHLIDKGYHVKTHDPAGEKTAKEILGYRVEFYPDIKSTCIGAYLIVIATEWEQFKTMDAALIRTLVTKPNIYDLRGIINKEDFIKNGFKVKAIGHGYLNEIGIDEFVDQG